MRDGYQNCRRSDVVNIDYAVLSIIIRSVDDDPLLRRNQKKDCKTGTRRKKSGTQRHIIII